MYLPIIFSKLRTWGIRGVYDWVIRNARQLALRRFFIANYSKTKYDFPQPGITLIADLSGSYSISKAARDFVCSLAKAGIPFQTFNLGRKAYVPPEDMPLYMTPRSEFDVGRYSHIVEFFQGFFPTIKGLQRHRIVFWEFESGIERAYDLHDQSVGIIGMSQFVVSYLKSRYRDLRVDGILYPFQLLKVSPVSREAVKKRFEFKDDDFVVFFNFDFGSSYARKNPEAAMRAFARAFEGVRDAKLVFKTKGASEHVAESAKLKKLARDLNVLDRYVQIDDFLSMDEVYALTDLCSVYISLHRGEGFGLGVAEAMSLGKPVVVTDYGATTEFCVSGNSIPIPYVMRSPAEEEHDHPCYLGVESWADPNIDAAAKALRDLYERPLLRNEIGNAASEWMSSHYSTQAFAQSVRMFLESGVGT